MQPQKFSTTGYLALIDGGRGVEKEGGCDKTSGYNLTNGWLKTSSPPRHTPPTKMLLSKCFSLKRLQQPT